MKEIIKDVMSEVFEVDRSKIDDSIKKFEYEKWDSLAHIGLVAALEQRFEVMFDPEEIMEINFIGDIEKLIEKYK